jgi:hypothetical protein
VLICKLRGGLLLGRVVARHDGLAISSTGKRQRRELRWSREVRHGREATSLGVTGNEQLRDYTACESDKWGSRRSVAFTV